ncbi:MAG: Holliday junction resolvase RuvX [Chloroflexi bacterium]|nr:Holliday junction resolvase RuvX [Chloroflexota bacterium]
MRILGLDIGFKRTGVAMSDEEEILASPLIVLENSDEASLILSISEMCNKNRVELIVVGLPQSLTGKIGKQATKVQEFVERLREIIKIPAITWDERLTTVTAVRMMQETRSKKAKNKQRIDAIAAAVILQSYLDRKK